VGKSLHDYLQNSRPPYPCPDIFLTCGAPYHPLDHPTAVSPIVQRLIQAAGIDSPSKGDARAFRHRFTTRVIRQGHSLNVADVLDHRLLSTYFL
jgi:site-specific recombinase XerD